MVIGGVTSLNVSIDGDISDESFQACSSPRILLAGLLHRAFEHRWYAIHIFHHEECSCGRVLAWWEPPTQQPQWSEYFPLQGEMGILLIEHIRQRVKWHPWQKDPLEGWLRVRWNGATQMLHTISPHAWDARICLYGNLPVRLPFTLVFAEKWAGGKTGTAGGTAGETERF